MSNIIESIWKGIDEWWLIALAEEVLEKPFSPLCLKRNSYINRVYELEEKASKERFILKIYRPNRWSYQSIEEEMAYTQFLIDKEIPCVAPITVCEKDGFTVAIFPKKGGRVLDELNQELWEGMGRLLGRMHAVSDAFSFEHRLEWTPELIFEDYVNCLLSGNYIPETHQSLFSNSATAILQRFSVRYKDLEKFPIHGDFHSGNLVIRYPKEITVLDFDDCCTGPAMVDISLLFPDEWEHYERERQWFKSGYAIFRDFPEKEVSLMPLLRVMRQVHYAWWCAQQSQDPDFKAFFPEWGSLSYWNELLREMNALMQK